MAYQTGVSSTIGQLVEAVKAFAVTQGFAAGPVWVAGGFNITRVVKHGISYHFTYNSTDLWLNTAEGSDGSGTAVSQLHACPINCRILPINPPHVGYHLFSHGERIHVAVELVTNVFNHFSFGMIEKNGNGWEGGAYVTGGSYWTGHLGNNPGSVDGRQSRPFGHITSQHAAGTQLGTEGHVRCTHTAGFKTARFFYSSQTNAIGNTNVAIMSGWDLNFDLISDTYSPNAFNGRAVLAPILVDIAFDRLSGAPSAWMQLGHIPDAATTNIANLNPKEMVNGDWMVFPLTEKNGPNTLGSYRSSGNYGVAFLK